MPAAYDRLKKESDPAWEAFVQYRDMGLERSLGKVAQSLGKSKPLMERWSRTHRWKARTHRWDMDADRRQREAQLKELEKMRARQIRTAVRMQGLGLAELAKLIKLSEESAGPILKPDDLLRVIKEGVTIERLNRGEPGEIVKSLGEEPDLSELSDEDLKNMKSVHRKLRKARE